MKKILLFIILLFGFYQISFATDYKVKDYNPYFLYQYGYNLKNNTASGYTYNNGRIWDYLGNKQFGAYNHDYSTFLSSLDIFGTHFLSSVYYDSGANQYKHNLFINDYFYSKNHYLYNIDSYGNQDTSLSKFVFFNSGNSLSVSACDDYIYFGTYDKSGNNNGYNYHTYSKNCLSEGVSYTGSISSGNSTNINISNDILFNPSDYLTNGVFKGLAINNNSLAFYYSGSIFVQKWFVNSDNVLLSGLDKASIDNGNNFNFSSLKFLSIVRKTNFSFYVSFFNGFDKLVNLCGYNNNGKLVCYYKKDVNYVGYIDNFVTYNSDHKINGYTISNNTLSKLDFHFLSPFILGIGNNKYYFSSGSLYTNDTGFDNTSLNNSTDEFSSSSGTGTNNTNSSNTFFTSVSSDLDLSNNELNSSTGIDKIFQKYSSGFSNTFDNLDEKVKVTGFGQYIKSGAIFTVDSLNDFIQTNSNNTCEMFNSDGSFRTYGSNDYHFTFNILQGNFLDYILIIPQKAIDFITNPINNTLSFFQVIKGFDDGDEICFLGYKEKIEYQKFFKEVNKGNSIILGSSNLIEIGKVTVIDYFFLIVFGIIFFFGTLSVLSRL